MKKKTLWHRSFSLGSFLGLEIRTKPSALLVAMLIWGIFTFVAGRFLKWKLGKAAASGFVAMLIHYLSEMWHQIGHAQMAEQTGHPMKGMEFWGPLSSSIYPKNEGMLPADVHIQRALGGPIFSFSLAFVSGMIALALRYLGGPSLILAYFTFLDNLLVFTVGALFPLSFNDGGTLVQWWGHRQSGKRFLVID